MIAAWDVGTWIGVVFFLVGPWILAWSMWRSKPVDPLWKWIYQELERQKREQAWRERGRK